ncbi:hypothetical protein PVAND_014670 [Polypedilum vanderplanki]|uniref:Syntaxin N-terminal domain-containing protein n=1 Tax=Polypedilum vanderplanki TaxID=319348 RepID=A0A9J6BAM3_POLVA|nr:hypothetical protein PVAND_014670 [Polypedilum vanderplanki]
MDSEKSTTINIGNTLIDINSQIAHFRDLLIQVGHDKHDSSDLRVQIRKSRRACVDLCTKAHAALLPQVKSDEITTPNDNPHMLLLFYLIQLFLRELIRSYHLLKLIPMDMSGYFENRIGTQNIGNVLGQLLLCKQINPDFHAEELNSITKDSKEVAKLLAEMQEFLPKQEAHLERSDVLTKDKTVGPWPAKRQRVESLYRNMGLLCCVSRPNSNYL